MAVHSMAIINGGDPDHVSLPPGIPSSKQFILVFGDVFFSRKTDDSHPVLRLLALDFFFHVEWTIPSHLGKLARDLTRPISPQVVVNSKGNGTPYFREILVGEILIWPDHILPVDVARNSRLKEICPSIFRT